MKKKPTKAIVVEAKAAPPLARNERPVAFFFVWRDSSGEWKWVRETSLENAESIKRRLANVEYGHILEIPGGPVP